MKKLYLLKIACITLLLSSFDCATQLNIQADPHSIKELVKRGEVHLPDQQIYEIKHKLGQLFYINIDGIGYQGEYAVDPGYFSLINKLQVGGVLVHYNTTDPHLIRKTNDKLSTLTDTPLFIGVDYVKLKRISAKTKGTAQNKPLLIGNGFTSGCLTRYSRLDSASFKAITTLHAFLLKSLGINHVLGPTIDNSAQCPDMVVRALLLLKTYKRFNLFTTLKHFPYLPLPNDLHSVSPDTKISLNQVNKLIVSFKKLVPFSESIMTTHLYNSLFDAQNIATFSTQWISYLKRSLNYNKLIMSDGLFMIKKYKEHETDCSALPFKEYRLPPQHHQVSIYALKAICAGNHMIILGGGSDTSSIFYDLLFFACQDNDTGRLLRKKIDEAYRKIVKIKNRNRKLLRAYKPLAQNIINYAIRLCTKIEDMLLEEVIPLT